MARHGKQEAAQFGLAASVQPGDLAPRQAAPPHQVQMLDAGLQARDVLFDLFDQGEMIGERGQPVVGFNRWRIDERRAGSDVSIPAVNGIFSGIFSTLPCQANPVVPATMRVR
jgi:hypothetical protein